MIEVDIEQGIPEWFKLREGIGTASKFSEIITPARGELSKSCNLYIGRIIAGEQSPEVGPTIDTYWTDRGLELEPEARRWYEMHTGYMVDDGGIIFNDEKTLAVSPDGKIDTSGLLEIKCLSPAYHIKYLLDGDTLPNEFKPQVHGGLAISERKWIDFLMYCPGYKERLIRVIPDAYTEKVSAALETFSALLEKAKSEVIK